MDNHHSPRHKAQNARTQQLLRCFTSLLSHNHTQTQHRMSNYQNQYQPGSWSDFFGDFYSGLAVGVGHSRWYIQNAIHKGWHSISSLGGWTSTDDEGRKDGKIQDTRRETALKVVGVGYGRTGTYSLALALDELGFPTLHTQHLYENAEIFDHFVNEIFYKSISQDEVIMGTPNFDLLLDAGFTATMDLPFALYYDQIHKKYPDCKFILTVRENSEVWFKSWDVMTKSIIQPAMYTSWLVGYVKKLEYYMRWLFSVVNTDKKYLSHPFPLPPQDREKSIASYEKHNQSVRDSIPSTHLLEYNVRQGWAPLCRFLEIPEADCPSAKGIPFPKSNSARAVQIQSFSAFIVFLIPSMFVMFSLFLLVFRKITGLTVIGWCSLQKSRILQGISVFLEQRVKKTV